MQNVGYYIEGLFSGLLAGTVVGIVVAEVWISDTSKAWLTSLVLPLLGVACFLPAAVAQSVRAIRRFRAASRPPNP